MNRSREDRRLPAGSLVTDLPLYYLSVLLEGLVGLLLVFGVWGELLSLLALEQRQALSQSGTFSSAADFRNSPGAINEIPHLLTR